MLPVPIPSNSFFILLYSSLFLLCCPTAFALSVSWSHTHYLISLIAFSFLFVLSLFHSYVLITPMILLCKAMHCHCFLLFIFHLPNFLLYLYHLVSSTSKICSSSNILVSTYDTGWAHDATFHIIFTCFLSFTQFPLLHSHPNNLV